jgi:hypothetical protein
MGDLRYSKGLSGGGRAESNSARLKLETPVGGLPTSKKCCAIYGTVANLVICCGRVGIGNTLRDIGIVVEKVRAQHLLEKSLTAE